MPLIGNILKPLAKSVLIPLGFTAEASATDAAIHKKLFRYDNTKLKLLNEEMNDIIKIVKSLEKSRLVINNVCETVKHETK